MNILDEFNKRFAGKTVELWQAGDERPFRKVARLHIEEFRPMLESEYNPSEAYRRDIPWIEKTLCAVVDWDKSEYLDPHSCWSPDQAPEEMSHLMPIVTEADFFFKDNRVVGIWKHQYVTMMEVAE